MHIYIYIFIYTYGYIYIYVYKCEPCVVVYVSDVWMYLYTTHIVGCVSYILNCLLSTVFAHVHTYLYICTYIHIHGRCLCAHSLQPLWFFMWMFLGLGVDSLMRYMEWNDETHSAMKHTAWRNTHAMKHTTRINTMKTHSTMKHTARWSMKHTARWNTQRNETHSMMKHTARWNTRLEQNCVLAFI